jgi:hypothetical protein
VPTGQRRAFFTSSAAMKEYPLLSIVETAGLGANHRIAEPGQDMTNDRSQPGEVSGLSKIEAEDLLDRLEASGCDPCQLSFVDGEGFKVRPHIASCETEVIQGGEALASHPVIT